MEKRGRADSHHLRIQVAAAVPQSVATAILEHREALLRACRSLDMEGSGQLPAQEGSCRKLYPKSWVGF